MIKNIITWGRKSETNSLKFLCCCVTLILLLFEVPLFIILFNKYGLYDPMPIKYEFLFVSLIYISVLLGFKISVKLLYNGQ